MKTYTISVEKMANHVSAPSSNYPFTTVNQEKAVNMLIDTIQQYVGGSLDEIIADDSNEWGGIGHDYRVTYNVSECEL